MIFRSSRATLFVLFLASPPGFAAVGDLASCETLASKAPGTEAPAKCLFELAAGTGPARAAAARRLKELYSARAGDPWPTLYLGHLRWIASPTSSETEQLYRAAVEVAARRGMPRAELLARVSLCRLLRDTGRMEEAKEGVERVVEIAGRHPLPFFRIKAAIVQANYWSARGDLEEAYTALQPVGGLVEEERSYPLIREYLFALNGVTLQTGRFPEARKGYERLATLASADKDPASEAVARFGLAKIRMDELGELPEEAGRRELLDLALRSLAAARAAQRPDLEAYALWMLGSVADVREAVDHLERCFDVAATPKHQSQCRAALSSRLAASDAAAAEKALDEALSLARQANDIVAQTSAWHHRMRVSWATGSRERALEDSLAALDVIEALRDLQEGSVRQPGLFSTWAEDYYWLSGRLLEEDSLEQAFSVMERMRSRTLSDALGLSDQAPGTAELRARRAGLLERIAWAQRRLFDADLAAGELDRVREELERLEAGEEELRARIARADPAFAAPRRSRFASLEQVRGALESDEALLSFQIAPWKDLVGDFGGGSWLLVSTRDAPMRVYRLPDRAEVRQSMDIFTGMFDDRNGSEEQAAANLYGKLLGPALAELPQGVRRLVIIPDDALHRLPFAALRPDQGSEPLVTRYEITLAPSATLWLHWRESRPAPAVTPALVLADPVSLATGDEPAAVRSATFMAPARLGKLHFARTEGKAVVRHLGGELLLAENASEAYLKSKGAGPYNLVHFATHAVTDEVHPDRSAVYLSPGDDKEDGILQVREIVDLDLDGRIVVLSSCESASGEILRGEGVMGLARGFFQAGAHTVVASLWPLRDDEGAALFDRFYRHLGKGKSVAAALQAAQRDRMEEGAPAAAWAGVVVLGDGDRVPVPGGRRNTGLVAGIALVILLMTAGLLLWRRGGARSSRS